MEFDEHWIGAVGDREAYDFIADRGRRCWLRGLQRLVTVQVKATWTRTSKNSFHVNCGKGSGQKRPYEKGDFDLLVIYVVPEDSGLFCSSIEGT